MIHVTAHLRLGTDYDASTAREGPTRPTQLGPGKRLFPGIALLGTVIRFHVHSFPDLH